MSVAQAFATKERSKIGFLHARKALKANDEFSGSFCEIDFVDTNY